MKKHTFYEVEQYTASGKWRGIGFFRAKKAAAKYIKEFNTGCDVASIRITKREFQD